LGQASAVTERYATEGQVCLDVSCLFIKPVPALWTGVL